MALPDGNTIKPGHGFPKNDHRAWPPYQDRTTAICLCSVLAVKSHQLQFQPNKVTRRKVTKKNKKKGGAPPRRES